MDISVTEKKDNGTTQRFIVLNSFPLDYQMGLLQKPSEKGYRNITLPLLKMEKLTAKESQWLVQGH